MHDVSTSTKDRHRPEINDPFLSTGTHRSGASPGPINVEGLRALLNASGAFEDPDSDLATTVGRPDEARSAELPPGDMGPGDPVRSRGIMGLPDLSGSIRRFGSVHDAQGPVLLGAARARQSDPPLPLYGEQRIGDSVDLRSLYLSLDLPVDDMNEPLSALLANQPSLDEPAEDDNRYAPAIGASQRLQQGISARPTTSGTGSVTPTPTQRLLRPISPSTVNQAMERLFPGGSHWLPSTGGHRIESDVHRDTSPGQTDAQPT